MVLEAIRKTAKYVQEHETKFLYLFVHKNNQGREQSVRSLNLKIEQSRKRIRELDKLIERIYEDNVLGKLSDERFIRMSTSYEAEQKELIAAVDRDEKEVKRLEQEKIDLRVFLETMRECTDIKELTPYLVNTLIQRIDIHQRTKDEDGNKRVKVDIHFTAVGIVDIPDQQELLSILEKMCANPLKSA